MDSVSPTKLDLAFRNPLNNPLLAYIASERIPCWMLVGDRSGSMVLFSCPIEVTKDPIRNDRDEETTGISKETFYDDSDECTMGQNNQKFRCKYWATRLSVRSLALTAQLFAYSALLTSLACAAALIRSLAHSLRSLPSSSESVLFNVSISPCFKP